MLNVRQEAPLQALLSLHYLRRVQIKRFVDGRLISLMLDFWMAKIRIGIGLTPSCALQTQQSSDAESFVKRDYLNAWLLDGHGKSRS